MTAAGVSAIVFAAVIVDVTGMSVMAAPEQPARQVLPTFPNECLVVGPLTPFARGPFHQDPVQARVVTGQWHSPLRDQTLRLPGGALRRWKRIAASVDGTFSDPALENGYASATVNSPDMRVVLLEASGHSLVYVNGEPRAGDPYEHGYVRLPILLRPGGNDFLFAVGGRHFKAALLSPRSTALLNMADLTLPDLPAGRPVETEGAVVVINASPRPAEHLLLRVSLGASPARQVRLPVLPPLAVRKVAFPLVAPPTPEGSSELQLQIMTDSKGGQDSSRSSIPLDSARIGVRVCRPEQTYRRTFRSKIDDSVQYYAVTPAARSSSLDRPALVLTLHGAGVEAFGQASCYAPKPWAHLVAPTNRRPFGFDWEDWGGLDALEVLAHAQKHLDTDPSRVYLTGHSMGGHGVWHLAATYPDRFAAIGPSAGWVSMWSYAGARHPAVPSPMQDLLDRASAPSDTLSLIQNYKSLGIYVLHGDRDDNVPVEQARLMKRRLAGTHPDFVYHEQPGAGHWWGSACVDWPPLFDFFRSHRIPRVDTVRQVDFVTASPGVSAGCRWASIEGQEHTLRPSSVRLRWDPERSQLSGQTANVSQLAIDLERLRPGAVIAVELDGQEVPGTTTKGPLPSCLRFVREGGSWRRADKSPASRKGPARYGAFKEVFRNSVQFVYGTMGTAQETAWALAKARYDAETFWYRGNGSIDVLPDTVFDPMAAPDRNVVLYGNADSNSAWKALLAASPVQVRRGEIQLGERRLTGADLGCILIRLRPGSARALIGVVGGSGPVGMRLTDRLPYFVSGVAYPDCVIFDPRVLTDSMHGVHAAGFFGPDWGVPTGEFAWEEGMAARR